MRTLKAAWQRLTGKRQRRMTLEQLLNANLSAGYLKYQPVGRW